ncbi:MAG: hypothetical protein WAO52_02025 [Prolixibacteraceae bacterium]
MKKLFFLLVIFFITESSFAVQPLRKPFLQIQIDGKTLKNGEVLLVKNGQKFKVEVEMQGGRRDYCKFPDTYADIAGTAQILSRGENGITYELNGITSVWKLNSENTVFSSDQFLQIKPLENRKSAEVTVSADNFEQTFLRISNTAKWMFSQNETNLVEENNAVETVFIRIQGKSDVWFRSENIQASGIRNEEVQNKMSEVQAACDSIQANFYRINIGGIQQTIRNLQSKVNNLKTTIEEIQASNSSYKVNVVFVGLPSDKPVSDIEIMSNIKKSWTAAELTVNEIQSELEKLTSQPSTENKNKLVDLIGKYNDWQYKLPDKTFVLLALYLPKIDPEQIKIPGNIHYIAEEKTVTDYPDTLQGFTSFLNQRKEMIPQEIQQINAIYSRIQAFRLFDGMLRSYFASIIWAEWQSTRGL